MKRVLKKITAATACEMFPTAVMNLIASCEPNDKVGQFYLEEIPGELHGTRVMLWNSIDVRDYVSVFAESRTIYHLWDRHLCAYSQDDGEWSEVQGEDIEVSV